MPEKKKERVELQFNMEKEADLLQFIDDNGTTRAGFIKSVIRQYMNAMQSMGQQKMLQQSAEIKGQPPEKAETIKSDTNKDKKKVLPKTIGASFSSNDFD